MIYLERFHKLAKWLQTQPELHIVEFKTFSPVSEEEIRRVEKKVDQKLPEDFKDFFKQSNGYRLRYKLRADDSDDGDEIAAVKIPSLEQIFNSPISKEFREGE